MARKSNIDYALKMQILKEATENNISLQEIADKYGIKKQTLNSWVKKYKTIGLQGFIPKEQNQSYSGEFKIKAAKTYLESNLSLMEVCQKYDISSVSVLSHWVKKYEKIIKKNQNPTALKRDKSKTFTIKEKLVAINYCLENDNNYTKTIQKFDITYNQIYNWVKKFKTGGEKALIDNRGLSKAKQKENEFFDI